MLWMAASEASDGHRLLSVWSVSRKIVEEKHNHVPALKSTGDEGLSQSGNGNQKASSEPLQRPLRRPGGCERPWDTAWPEAQERTRWSPRKACLFLLTLLSTPVPFCSRKYKCEGIAGPPGPSGDGEPRGPGVVGGPEGRAGP